MLPTLIIIFFISTQHCVVTEDHDYKKLLELSLKFYKAQRSGTLPANYEIPWRKSSFTDDKAVDGTSLDGGYFDAGDYMKYNSRMAFSTTVVAWGLIEFKQAYVNAGLYEKAKEMIKWTTDYFIKCHTSTNTIYVQCGITNQDHSFWGRATEYYDTRPSGKTPAKPRPCLQVNTTNPGSDVAADMAATLAAASIVFSDDAVYKASLLEHSKEIYEFATAYVGPSFNSISFSDPNTTHYHNLFDELAWGAVWLYNATNNATYLNKAETYWKSVSKPTSKFLWNFKGRGIALILATLNPSATGYKTYIEDYCNASVNRNKSTRGTTWYHGKWGYNRIAASTAFICLMAEHKLGLNYKDYGIGQINSLLGSKTKQERSFVVGYGYNYPKRPHHRGASCKDRPAVCNIYDYNKNEDNPQVIEGALVSGPQWNHPYEDNRKNYQQNEVSMTQAPYHSALAAILHLNTNSQRRRDEM